MTLRLTVQRAAWETHLASLAASVDGLMPVVKGNGYGFGRATLHPIAARFADVVCVGTVHELDHVEPGVTPVVLTPTTTAPATDVPILTVGSVADVHALAGWHGAVTVKLQSSMRRFGAAPGELDSVVDAARDAGLDVAAFSVHLPLAGDEPARVSEVVTWLARLDGVASAPLWLSHLQPSSFAALQRRHAGRRLRLRLGTQLWHGDKSFLHLSADVLAIHRVRAGDRAGYRLVPAPSDGSVVVIAAGSAHGIAELPGGLSPFHHARSRLALLEPPHMHSSMVFVPAEQPCPAVGQRVDVQRPLIAAAVDEVEWR